MLLAQRKKRQQLAGKIGHSDEEYDIGPGRAYNHAHGPAPTSRQINRGAAYAPPPWSHERGAPEVNMYPKRSENNINNCYNNNPLGDNAYYNYNAGGGNGAELFRRPMNFPSVLPPLVTPPCPSILPRPSSFAARPALVFDNSPAFREAACVSPLPMPIPAPQPARVPFSLPYINPMPYVNPMPAPLSAPVSGRARSNEHPTPRPAHGYVPTDENDPVAERREARRRAIEIQEENARLCEERLRRRREEKRREREEQYQMELRAQAERVEIGRREQVEMAQEHGEADNKMYGRRRQAAPGLPNPPRSYNSNDNANHNNKDRDMQLREDLRQQIEEKKRRDADEARRRDEEDRRHEQRIGERAKSAGPLGSAPAAPNTYLSPSAITSAEPNYTPSSISNLALPLDLYPTSLLPMDFSSFTAPLPPLPPLPELPPLPPLPDLSFPLTSAGAVPTAPLDLSLPPPPPLFDTVAFRSAGPTAPSVPGTGPQMTHQLQDMIEEHESLQRMLEGEVRRRPQSLPLLSDASVVSMIDPRPAPLPLRAASLGEGEELSAEPSRFVGEQRRSTKRPATVGKAPATAE